MTSPTLTNLIALLADYACVPEDSIVFTEPLAAIGLDSLDIIQLVHEIEDHFQIDLPESAYPDPDTTVAALHDSIKTLTA